MESFARDPQLALVPIPRVVRWLDGEMVPTTTVDSTCMANMATQTIKHDGPGGDGFCACGCRHLAGEIVATPIVQDILRSMAGGCSTCP